MEIAFQFASLPNMAWIKAGSKISGSMTAVKAARSSVYSGQTAHVYSAVVAPASQFHSAQIAAEAAVPGQNLYRAKRHRTVSSFDPAAFVGRAELLSPAPGLLLGR